jgi:uncharacterized protein YdaU (DUF1376 family)
MITSLTSKLLGTTGWTMAKIDIWMPLYVADYLADTSRLSTEQHGAYLLLLIDYWRNGPLPDDDAVLAQITRMSPDAWSNARSTLQAFFKHESGKWVHGRVEVELAKAKRNGEANSIRAKAAASARWGASSNTTSDASSIAPSMPKAMLEDVLEQCPSPSPSKVLKTITSADADFGKFWEVWPSTNRKVAKAKCLEFWKRHRLSEVTDQILAHLKTMKTSEQWLKGFEPAPLTYLNQRRWEDGLPVAMNSNALPDWARRRG